MTPRGFWAYWYFSVPDMILVALIYVLIAYGILSFVLRDGNIVMRVLGMATSPVLVPLGALTPRLLPRPVVILYAVVCLYIVRIVLFIASQTLR